MLRRQFLAAPLFAQSGPNPRPLTRGPKHHFFGYYGISPWNKSLKTLVCLESDFQDHLPRPEEAAGIVVVDTATGAMERVTETRAWNFQQGAMLHWNPLKPETEILFNERDGGRIISAAYDLATGRRRTLPRAINGVSHNGRYAVCLTYGRLTRLRPVVGYVGAVDPNPNADHPENDGVFLMDLETGKSKLVVSIRQIYERLVPKHPELKTRAMWFNHTVFNKNDTRFFFLARCWEPLPSGGKRLESAMFTSDLDGRDIREVVAFGKGVSHFEWRNDREIMATFRVDGKVRHVLFTDGQSDYRVIGADFFEGDGHCSFARDSNWLVTDRNVPITLEKRLFVYELGAQKGRELARFPMFEERFLGGDLRCDLHPRWRADMRQICVDALDTRDRTRQVHIVDVTDSGNR
jgi:hypothetical protein